VAGAPRPDGWAPARTGQLSSDPKRQQHRVLLAAVSAGQSDSYADLRHNPGRAAAQTAPKESGLIYSCNGPRRVHESDDVRFSLRYSGDGHIARELGEETPATGTSGASPW
jgi:hypothetical protein